MSSPTDPLPSNLQSLLANDLSHVSQTLHSIPQLAHTPFSRKLQTMIHFQIEDMDGTRLTHDDCLVFFRNMPEQRSRCHHFVERKQNPRTRFIRSLVQRMDFAYGRCLGKQHFSKGWEDREAGCRERAVQAAFDVLLQTVV